MATPSTHHCITTFADPADRSGEHSSWKHRGSLGFAIEATTQKPIFSLLFGFKLNCSLVACRCRCPGFTSQLWLQVKRLSQVAKAPDGAEGVEMVPWSPSQGFWASCLDWYAYGSPKPLSCTPDSSSEDALPLLCCNVR